MDLGIENQSDEFGVSAKKDEACPIATTDIAVNLKNRQKAIDTAGYGPLNPKEANSDFWDAKAERWNVDATEAKKQLCGNCAAFIKTERILNCINAGLSAGDTADSWDTVAAGDLGYCEAFDFKCAASRTCDAWIVGGPITEENRAQAAEETETKSAREADVNGYLYSLTDDELDILFPETEEISDGEAKWLFDVGGAFLRRSLTNRRKRRRKRGWKADVNGVEEKGSKKPVLRDPDGGLTAAGRKYFKEKEGANLKPGVKGPANTPEKMRRKGSFLVRFFSNPRGPLVDEKGRPTRLALSARAWGEPAPRNAEAARKLADKGRNLLDRYNKVKSPSRKSFIENQEVKALGPTVGQRANGTTSQNKPIGTSGATGGRPGSTGRRGNYDPNARDADGDGSVQEGTDYVRQATPRNKPSYRGRGTGGYKRRAGQAKPKPNMNRQPRKAWMTDRGSADTRERGAIRNDLTNRGFDAEAFRKFVDQQSRNLKPGQKTNWNPGRLPNGGKIAADGTYIPPDVVRRDDKTQSDYYRNRRSQNNTPQYRGPRRPAPGAQPPRQSADSAERGSLPWKNGPQKPGDSKKPGIYDGKPKLPWKNGPQKPGDGKGPSVYDGKPKLPWKNGPQKPGSGKGPSIYDGKPKLPWSTNPQAPDQKPRSSSPEEQRNKPSKPKTYPYSGGPKKPGNGKPGTPWKAGPQKPSGGKVSGPYNDKPKKPWSSGPQKPKSSKPNPYNSKPKKPWGNA